jgi:hypothetical protein
VGLRLASDSDIFLSGPHKILLNKKEVGTFLVAAAGFLCAMGNTNSSRLHRVGATIVAAIFSTPVPYLIQSHSLMTWLMHPSWLKSFFFAPCLTQTIHLN